ncbi:MAG: hypothetical protein WDN44_13535 [Sphingomonas sp.]
MRLVMPALLALLPLPALAQTPPPQDQGIVVRGEALEHMSDWRVAETDHVIVYSAGPVAELTRIAHNLERLHFLLSILLNRIGKPDDALKLRVTLIGDVAEFDAMDLRNIRSQQGPFVENFEFQRYYDPREDGAVMASGSRDATVALVRSPAIDLNALGVVADPLTGQNMPSLFGSGGGMDGFTPEIKTGGITVRISAESRIYAGFAQHFLLTYFPAAYPRWYLDGIGELFSTIHVRPDGALEYGQMPEGFRKAMEWHSSIPVADVVTGRYLDMPVSKTHWNPFHAWVLTHYLFFSDARRAQLSRYLASIGRGATMAQAATVFGDLTKLQREVAAYDNHRISWVRMTYPPQYAPDPVVEQLTRGRAEFLKGRIELGSRVETLPPPPAAVDAATAQRIAKAREQAREAHDKWLARLREHAAQFAYNLEAQLLLAEAECRSGNNDRCLTAAEGALQIGPNDSRALAWKGIALAQRAIAGPAPDRTAKLAEARAFLVRANHADTEGSLPLLGYYRSFADAGEAAPDLAVEGLLKAVQNVPAAPGPRLLLGQELAREGHPDAARVTLMPVTNGGYDSPEKVKAEAVAAGLPGD